MHECIGHCKVSSFADDTRISKAISYTNDCESLQTDLNNITLWSKNNNMMLHEDKFVYMNYNIRSRMNLLAKMLFFSKNFQYVTSKGEILEPSTSVKDLGVTFSSDMSWSCHIPNLIKAAKKKTGWVLSIFKDRSPFAMLTLFKSLIRSLLEFACPVWAGLSMENLHALESIQRSFTNKIDCPENVNNYWERLQFLKIMSLQRRRERYCILHMWKIRNGKTSNDLGINFSENLRFGTVANVPPLVVQSSMRSKTLFDSSFSVFGPSLWNRIPKYVRNIDSLTDFKVKLDTFLQTIQDQPPVDGYVSQNNNSLMDWCPSLAL